MTGTGSRNRRNRTFRKHLYHWFGGVRGIGNAAADLNGTFKTGPAMAAPMIFGQQIITWLP